MSVELHDTHFSDQVTYPEPFAQLRFNSLLNQLGLDASDVVLLRHQDHRAKKGRTPYELWRDDKPAFEQYQSTQDFRNRPKLTRVKYWASFVGTADGKTMFVGTYGATYRGILEENLYRAHADGIDQAGAFDVYDLKEHGGFKDLAGRLFIEWGKGARSWIQRADHGNKLVTELRAKFSEDAFPGFLEFMSPLSRIEALPPGWITALKSVGGIYLLTCPKTKEQYVGSASGAEGFWQRWVEYAHTGHGGDVALKSRDPSDYQVSVLEVAGSQTDRLELLAMEARWKRKLQSREMGFNRN